MNFRLLHLLLGFVLWMNLGFSQDYFSYGGGNFSGLQQLYSNPATLADNRLKFDLALGGFDFTFTNSWFRIKREALAHSGSFTKPASLHFPLSWTNATPNVPNNVFKNFSFFNNNHSRSVLLENRLILPSFLIQIDSKNAIAFSWNLRQFANIDGISSEMANLFENELDLNVTQNHRIENKNFSAVQMSWAEYGFTYARVLKDKHQHFLKAGLSTKILQGLESAYLHIKELEFLFSTKDSLSYFKSDFSYAHSANFNSDPFKSVKPLAALYAGVTKLRPGFDVGFIYEWRPNFLKYRYHITTTQTKWRNDLNKYKLKIGASVTDIGKITFKKEKGYYDLSVLVTDEDFRNLITVKNYAIFDSILRADYSNKTNNSSYSIMLPTALNTQIDYSFNQFFYLNLSSHLTNFYKSNTFKVHNFSSLCIAPRFEHYWLEVSLPLTYNTLLSKTKKYLSTGFNVRLGPLSVGTSNLKPLLNGDVSNYNVYALLRLPIPYASIHDQDQDGVPDKKDACIDETGEISLNGCPDKDHDLIIDKLDACPHQAGTAEFKGCPDTDMDGVRDADDACPTERGLAFLKGCPDKDHDSIPDKEDVCPDIAGPKLFKGCPDKDEDGIADKDDACPLLKGPKKFKGCPDSDGDLVHDGEDNCVLVYGPKENFGCPWPDRDHDGIPDREDSCVAIAGVKILHGCPQTIELRLSEKKILFRAFSNLEFVSGKAIIKPTSFPTLNALAILMVEHEHEWNLILSGHTDNLGSEDANMILSEKRALALEAYLIKKGVPKNNMQVEWFGQTQPVADNSKKDGRKKNRRVELKLMLKN